MRKLSFWQSSILLSRLHLRLHGTRRVLQTENHHQLWRQVIPEICHIEQLQLFSRFSYKTQPGASYPPAPGIYDLPSLPSLSCLQTSSGSIPCLARPVWSTTISVPAPGCSSSASLSTWGTETWYLGGQWMQFTIYKQNHFYLKMWKRRRPHCVQTLWRNGLPGD